MCTRMPKYVKSYTKQGMWVQSLIGDLKSHMLIATDKNKNEGDTL